MTWLESSFVIILFFMFLGILVFYRVRTSARLVQSGANALSKKSTFGYGVVLPAAVSVCFLALMLFSGGGAGWFGLGLLLNASIVLPFALPLNVWMLFFKWPGRSAVFLNGLVIPAGGILFVSLLTLNPAATLNRNSIGNHRTPEEAAQAHFAHRQKDHELDFIKIARWTEYHGDSEEKILYRVRQQDQWIAHVLVWRNLGRMHLGWMVAEGGTGTGPDFEEVIEMLRDRGGYLSRQKTVQGLRNQMNSITE